MKFIINFGSEHSEPQKKEKKRRQRWNEERQFACLTQPNISVFFSVRFVTDNVLFLSVDITFFAFFLPLPARFCLSFFFSGIDFLPNVNLGLLNGGWELIGFQKASIHLHPRMVYKHIFGRPMMMRHKKNDSQKKSLFICKLKFHSNRAGAVESEHRTEPSTRRVVKKMLTCFSFLFLCWI